MKAAAKLRTFISIELPEELRQSIRCLQRKLIDSGGDVRWLRMSGVHLTLRFLGPVAPTLIPEIISALELAAGGKRSIRVKLKGVGAFPSLLSPRVIWVGLEESQDLIELQRDIDDALRGIGKEAEKRAFKPHLTIGRVRSAGGRLELLKGLEDALGWEAGTTCLSRLCLMKSELRPGGAEYTVLWSKTLISIRR